MDTPTRPRVTRRPRQVPEGIGGQSANRAGVRTWMSAALLASWLIAPAPAAAASARVAALQVALRAHAVYAGAVDGLPGPATAAGTKRFQAHAGLVPDGIAGPR